MIEPSGDIKDMIVPWIFQGLRKEKQGGTVVFAHEQTVKKVYFRDGEIIYAVSNLDADQLGACLLRDAKITKQYYDATNEIVQKTGKNLSAVLLEYEFLTQQDLVEGAKSQVKQIIFSLFSWREGRYIYDNGPLPLSEIMTLPMDAGELVVEGIQGLDWQIMRRSLPSLKTVLRPSADASLAMQGARLGQDYYTVLSLIDGRRSIEEICSQSGIGDFNTLKAVYVLLALTMADQGALKTEKEMKSARAAVHEPAAAKEQETKDPAIDMGGETENTPVSKQMIEQAHAALLHQDNYEVLGITSNATAQEIKKAYFKLAKVYHPDRHMEPGARDLKEKLESLFTALHGAYQTLSDPAKRQEYDGVRGRRQSTAQFEERRPEGYVEDYAEKTKQAEAYFNAGLKDFKIGNFWGAAESLAWATRLDPVKSNYFYHYGLALARIPRRMHEAEESLRKAIEIDPLRPEYYLDLGGLYERSGLAAKALAVYNKALLENPDSEKIREAIKTAGGKVLKDKK